MCVAPVSQREVTHPREIAIDSLYSLPMRLPWIVKELGECGDCKSYVWVSSNRSIHETAYGLTVWHSSHACTLHVVGWAVALRIRH